MDWRIVAALAVPVLGFLGALATKDREPRAYRRLKHATEALVASPDGSQARDTLDELVALQATALLQKEHARFSRKVSWLMVTLITFFVALGAVVGYWAWVWIMATWGSGWVWLSIPVSGVVGLLIVLFIVSGFEKIYDPQ